MSDDTYNFSVAFERIVAVMAATHPRFYGVAGHALAPPLFRDEDNGLLVRAAQAIAKDLGHGPSDVRVVMQRIDRWVDEGSVTQDQRTAALDVILDAPELPPEDEVLVDVKHEIQRKLRGEVVRRSMEEYSRNGDMAVLEALIGKARAVGTVDTSVGSMVGSGSFARINSLNQLDRLPTGIAEIDMNLNGGLPRGNTGLIAAGTGGGKSMYLTHQVATGMRSGLFVVLATLELSKELQEARIIANLTGVNLNAIVEGKRKRAEKILEKMYPVLGTCIVQEFPAKLTTIPDIINWVKRCEDVEGHKVDVVVLDYADKVKSHDPKDKNSYEAGGTVTESFRLFIHETRKWGWTASQPQRKAGKEKGRRIEADDLSDSQNKARIVDLIITAQRVEDQITYYCPKFRGGVGEWTVGPLPHDWGNARQIVMVDE